MRPWMIFRPAPVSHEPAPEKMFVMLFGRFLTVLTALETADEIALMRPDQAEDVMLRTVFQAPEKRDAMEEPQPETVLMMPDSALETTDLAWFHIAEMMAHRTCPRPRTMALMAFHAPVTICFRASQAPDQSPVMTARTNLMIPEMI